MLIPSVVMDPYNWLRSGYQSVEIIWRCFSEVCYKKRSDFKIGDKASILADIVTPLVSSEYR